MIDFASWEKRHDDWSAKSPGMDEKANPDPKDVSLRTPDYGRSHTVSPVSSLDAGTFAVGGTYPSVAAATLIGGSTPANGGRTANGIWRCNFTFAQAESGADASNYTQVVFKVGDSFASSDTICTGTTENNPAAGQTTFVVVSFGGQSLYRPKSNKTLFVSLSKVGEASAVLSNKAFAFSFEFLQERIA